MLFRSVYGETLTPSIVSVDENGDNRIMNQEKIERINALYRKSKAEGLTEEEKKEQDLLRKEYIASVKSNLRNQLNNIDVINEQGKVENLGVKYGNKGTTS